MSKPVLWIVIPCYNEAHAIGDVVKSFRAALPNARIFVYDNNSQDNTIAVARDAAEEFALRRQGGLEFTRQQVDQPEAEIMPVVGVFAAGVAETDDQAGNASCHG